MSWLDSLLPRDFRQSLDSPVRRFMVVTFLARMGTGLTLSLYVVYLHNVRGFSTTFSTLLLMVGALVALATGPIWGTLTDRYGPLAPMVASFILESLSLILWAYATTETAALLASVALALFGGGGWGPGMTLLTRLVPEEHRQRAFGFNFMLVNLGIGFGALFSASIVDLHHPATFTLLYLLNAGVTLATTAVLITLRGHGHADPEVRESAAAREEGWREVLADRRLVTLVAASLVLLLGGYGSQEAGYSLFVVNDLHLSVHTIGVIFFFNTTTIVLAQLGVINRIEGRSRTRVMAVVGLSWFAFWALLGAALAMPVGLEVPVLVVGMVIFALGETLLQPASQALVNHLAAEHLRGRYNAALGLTWGVAGTLAPVITALFFDRGLGNWWPLATGAISLGGSAMMLALRHRLSPDEDGVAVAALP